MGEIVKTVILPANTAHNPTNKDVKVIYRRYQAYLMRNGKMGYYHVDIPKFIY